MDHNFNRTGGNASGRPNLNKRLPLTPRRGHQVHDSDGVYTIGESRDKHLGAIFLVQPNSSTITHILPTEEGHDLLMTGGRGSPGFSFDEARSEEISDPTRSSLTRKSSARKGRKSWATGMLRQSSRRNVRRRSVKVRKLRKTPPAKKSRSFPELVAGPEFGISNTLVPRPRVDTIPSLEIRDFQAVALQSLSTLSPAKSSTRDRQASLDHVSKGAAVPQASTAVVSSIDRNTAVAVPQVLLNGSVMREEDAESDDGRNWLPIEMAPPKPLDTPLELQAKVQKMQQENERHIREKALWAQEKLEQERAEKQARKKNPIKAIKAIFKFGKDKKKKEKASIVISAPVPLSDFTLSHRDTGVLLESVGEVVVDQSCLNPSPQQVADDEPIAAQPQTVQAVLEATAAEENARIIHNPSYVSAGNSTSRMTIPRRPVGSESRANQLPGGQGSSPLSRLQDGEESDSTLAVNNIQGSPLNAGPPSVRPRAEVPPRSSSLIELTPLHAQTPEEAPNPPAPARPAPPPPPPIPTRPVPPIPAAHIRRNSSLRYQAGLFRRPASRVTSLREQQSPVSNGDTAAAHQSATRIPRPKRSRVPRSYPYHHGQW